MNDNQVKTIKDQLSEIIRDCKYQWMRQNDSSDYDQGFTDATEIYHEMIENVVSEIDRMTHKNNVESVMSSGIVVVSIDQKRLPMFGDSENE